MKKTGIFGGAFNPVHNGHVRLAEEAVKQLKLRRLLIIPTYVSPHKHTDLAPYEDRAEMCRRAFGHIPGVEVSDIEYLETVFLLGKYFLRTADRKEEE